MTIEAITFDLEGTIIDVEGVHHQAHINSAEDVGVYLTLDECIEKLPNFLGGPDEKVAEQIAGLAGISHYSHIFQSKRDHYTNLLRNVPIGPRSGFLDFFLTVKESGLNYAIGSVTNEEQARVLIDKGGIRELFGYDRIVLREDVANPKPAPDVWIKTAEIMGVNPDEQIVFEDSPGGIIGATQIGAYCVAIPTYVRADVRVKLQKAGAKEIYQDWNEPDLNELLINAS